MTTALIMGYGPFGTFPINPAGMAAERLNGVSAGNVQISSAILTNDFYRTPKTIESLLLERKPDIAIGLGVYWKEPGVRIEKIGINLMDYRWIDSYGSPPEEIPDNRGNKPMQEKIFRDGPAAYFSNMPIEEIVDRLKENEIPSQYSFVAGTHGCNLCLYTILHTISTHQLKAVGGFMHLPLLPEQAVSLPNMPSMSLDMMTKALRIAIEVTGNKLAQG